MGRRWLVVVRTRLSGFGDRLKGGNAIALKHLVSEVRKPNTVVVAGGIKGAIALGAASLSTNTESYTSD